MKVKKMRITGVENCGDILHYHVLREQDMMKPRWLEEKQVS